jgi:Domain of unknown function (DUF4153)
MTDQQTPLNADWPQRAWALALIGATIGLIVHALTQGGIRTETRALALAGGLLTGGIALAFVTERLRIIPALVFALSAGLVVGLTLYLNGGTDNLQALDGWRVASAFIAVAIAAPLFQSWLFMGMPRKAPPFGAPYPIIHNRVWMNMLLWFACWAFAGLVILIGFLLGALFDLIGIHALATLMNKSWFEFMLVGGAFGTAAGVLRDREEILGTLQTVVRTVFSVLAPVIAVALSVFLVATLLTGLSSLWDATRSTTPILLATTALALILINAAVADAPETEAKSPILRYAAMILAVTILPLGLIAALSVGVRINQYGLSPDRIWALIFTATACAIGLAYLVSLIRARSGWSAHARIANVRLAIGLCGLAFLLATPLISFSAVSTRDQISRLESGKVSPLYFSWSALRFDYGPAGMAALKTLALTGKTEDIRKRAAGALATKDEDRWDLQTGLEGANTQNNIETKLVIHPTKVPLPETLKRLLAKRNVCDAVQECALYFKPGSHEAFYVFQTCATCGWQVETLETVNANANDWTWSNEQADILGEPAPPNAFSAAKVEIRTVTKRQVFVNGQPVGAPLADAARGE